MELHFSIKSKIDKERPNLKARATYKLNLHIKIPRIITKA